MKNKKQTTTGLGVPQGDSIPQDLAQIVDKLRSAGPVMFTGEELGRLLAAFEDVTRMVQGMAAELTRHNLQMVPTINPDGSVSFDLQPAPPDNAQVSVN